MMLQLTPNGSLTLFHSLTPPILPPGDPAASTDPYRDPTDARSLEADPQPITDQTNYPERIA